MAEWVQRDRAAVTALDELLRRTADARLDQLAHQLATALPADGRPVEHTRVLVRLALDFCTWRRLDREGLDDPIAVTVMADVVTPPPAELRARSAGWHQQSGWPDQRSPRAGSLAKIAGRSEPH